MGVGEPGSDFDDYVAARSVELLRFAWFLTGDVHDAEDVVQSALAKLYARWDRVRRSDDVDAYVRRSVVNASHSRFRRRRVRQVPLEHAERVGALSPAYVSVEDRTGLIAALSDLTARQRQAVVLRYLHDLSEAETAAAMGCAVGTVKSTASRALERLRTHPALSDGVPWRTS